MIKAVSAALWLTLASYAEAATLRLGPAADSQRQRSSYVTRGKHGMVVAAHPAAAEAGLAALRAGGNAADAAVAASFAISVVRPQSTGLGGGGFLLHYDAKSGEVSALDFRERAPLKATRDMFLDVKGEPASFLYNGTIIPDASVNGHLAAGVPGVVKGLVEFHKKHGKLPLAKVMAGAIALADGGFPVYQELADAIKERAELIKDFPATAAIFLPGGKPPKVGARLQQRDLAKTLRLIAANGADGFYKGSVAKAITDEMAAGKGLITQADLDAYEVKSREPVRGTYRGYTIASMPPPSSGGTHIIEIMNMLEPTDYGKLGFGTVESTHLLAEAMRRAFADRAEYLGDPDFVSVPLAGLLSKDYAKRLLATINFKAATPSKDVKPGNPPPGEHPSTTHLSVVDKDGNAVSTTQTVNYTFGSLVVAPGTGVVLNDEMDDFAMKPGVPNVFGLVGKEANAIAARKTMLSSMSPSFVFDADKKLRLVVGSPGGPRIITATLQTMLNVIDFKMPLEDANHAARIHHQWLPDELKVEPNGLAPEVVEALTRMGHKVVVGGHIGDVEAISVSDQGLVGVSDIRSEGAPRGY